MKKIAPQVEFDVRGSHILVVDDEPTIIKLLRSVLENDGYYVDRAEDGDQALDLLSKNDYDLLIVDKNLPRVSGIEVIRKSREIQPRAEYIIVTGYASYESAVEALRLGVFDYLEKPFPDINIILVKVKRALERQRLQHANQILANQLRAADADMSNIRDSLASSFKDTDKLQLYLEEMVKRETVELAEENIELKRTTTNANRASEKLSKRVQELDAQLPDAPPAFLEVKRLARQIQMSVALERVSSIQSTDPLSNKD